MKESYTKSNFRHTLLCIFFKYLSSKNCLCQQNRVNRIDSSNLANVVNEINFENAWVSVANLVVYRPSNRRDSLGMPERKTLLYIS